MPAGRTLYFTTYSAALIIYVIIMGALLNFEDLLGTECPVYITVTYAHSTKLITHR